VSNVTHPVTETDIISALAQIQLRAQELAEMVAHAKTLEMRFKHASAVRMATEDFQQLQTTANYLSSHSGVMRDVFTAFQRREQVYGYGVRIEPPEETKELPAATMAHALNNSRSGQNT